MTRTTKAARRVARTLIIIAMTLLVVSGLAQAASYVYDANGRLRAITASTGASSEYIYDALGNLVAVDSIPSGVKAIFAFTPNHGPVGQSVTIIGVGFSTTKASNTVKFNGTPVVTITSATTTQLVVTVPTGATTGPISVTVGGVTATSLDNFYVTTDSGGQPPTVTSFTPAVANAGMSVAVVGSHFVSLAGSTQAGVDDYTGTVTPTSDTQLSFSVSPYTGSGLVTVTTSYGTGQSAQPLIVVPTSIGAASVISTATLTVGGSGQTINIGTANKYGAVTFQATAGQWLSLQFSSFTTVPASGTLSVSVYGPTGLAVISNAAINSSNLSLHLPPAANNGTYTAVATPGAATSQFVVAVESAVTLSSTPTSIATTVVGQSKRAIFEAVAGTNLSLGMGNLTITPSGWLSYQIQEPHQFGSAYIVGTCVIPGCHQSLLNVPLTGWYNVVFTPAATTTASFAATLSTDVAAALTSNHAYALNLAAHGQIARLTFSGTAGQYVGFNVGSLAVSPAGDFILTTLINPDGSIPNPSISITSSTFVNEAVLSQTGTYTLQVEPAFADTATAQVTLASNPIGTLTLNGSAVAKSVTFPGEAIYYSFAGTAGQFVSFALSNVTTSDNQPVAVSVTSASWGPNPQSLGSCTPPGCHFLLNNLPSTANYIFTVTPSLADTTSVSASISSDVSAVLSPNTMYSLSLAKPGQVARLTYSGTAGQFFGYNLANIVSSTAGDPITVTTFFPDGTRNPAGGITTAANTFLNLPALAQTGTYVVQIEPTNAETATAQLTLTPNPDPTLTINGSSTTVTTTSPNENAALTFSATVGQNLSLALDNISLTPNSSDQIFYSVLKPDSTLLVSGQSGHPFHQLLTALPSTGVYTVTFHPGDSRNTMSFRATLTSDLAGALTAGTPSPINLASPGQTARLTFSGTTGQNLGIYLSSIATTPSGDPLELTIFNPDGTTNSTSAPTSTQLTIFPTLTQTGTYVVQVEPNAADVASAQVTLVADPTSSITIDGATVNESTTVAGEYAYLTFSGTTGQNVSLGITNASTSPTGGTFAVRVLNSAQTQIAVTDCSSAGCHIALPTLATGTYTIKVTPDSAETLAFGATLYSDLTGSLVVNTAFPVSVTHAGQVAHLTFAGTSGQNDAILVSSIATVPSGDAATVTVFNPDGTTAGAITTATNATLNLPTLTQTGTYVVQAELKNADTGSLQLTLSSSVPGALTVDGPAIPESTGAPNQTLNLSFSGAAGQNLSLAFSSVTPAATFSVTFHQPNMSSMPDNTSCSASGCHYELLNLPSTGTYTVTVIPNVATSFNAQLMSYVTGTLSANTPFTVNLAKPGQIALLTFSGTVGQDEGLYLTNLTNNPSSELPEIYPFNPDDSLASNGYAANNATEEMSPLSQSGTFTVLVDPEGADTSSVQITLTPDTTSSMTINGSAVTLNPPDQGQYAIVTFTGTANEGVTLKYSNASTTPAGGELDFYISDPNGNYYYSGNCSSATCNIQMSPLPLSGTYSIYEYPDDETRSQSLKLQMTSP